MFIILYNKIHATVIFLSMFLPIVLGIYFLAEERFRNSILLCVSLFFYAWEEPKAVFLMIGLITLSYFIARLIDGILKLGFKFENPLGSKDVGISDDSRKLGVGFKTMYVAEK